MSSVCGRCDKKLSVEGDFVSCSGCSSCFDYECAGLTEATYRRMTATKKNSWRCSVCRESSKKAGKNLSQVTNKHDCEQDENQCLKEMLTAMDLKFNRYFVENEKSVKNLESKLANMHDNMEKQGQFYDDLLLEVRLLKEENKRLSQSVNNLKSEIIDKNREINDLSKRLNNLEQYGRGVNLEVHGLESKNGSEPQNLRKEMAKLAEKLHVSHKEEDIEVIHTLPQRENTSRPPVVIVQFTSKRVRNQWLDKKKELITNEDINAGTGPRNIYLNENLTPYFKALLWKTKQACREKGFRFTWVKNGKIFVRKDQNERLLRIEDDDDLNKIK